VTHAFRCKILLETRLKIEFETNRIQKDSENEEEQFVDEYMKKWDILKFPNGYLLVSII